MIATSSALAERTVPVPPAAVAAASAVTCPNAPKRTFAIERFIALLIIIVRKVPDAPTSMPLTIRTLFSSSKPVAATARPVNAFSSEITTGMSAPPIGSTNRTPKRRERPISATSAHCASQPAQIATPSAAAAPSRTRFPTFWPG